MKGKRRQKRDEAHRLALEDEKAKLEKLKKKKEKRDAKKLEMDKAEADMMLVERDSHARPRKFARTACTYFFRPDYSSFERPHS